MSSLYARNFTETVIRFYTSESARPDQTDDAFEAYKVQILKALGKDLPPNPEHHPALKPASQMLSSAAAGYCQNTEQFKSAIEKLADQFKWQTNSHYEGVFPPSFFDSECFTEIIGPAGILLHKNIQVGLLVMAPDTDYPAHHHAATEWYHILSGNALWQQGGDDFIQRQAGSAIFHQNFEPHAMRTQNKALLALFSWAGDISSEATPL